MLYSKGNFGNLFTKLLFVAFLLSSCQLGGTSPPLVEDASPIIETTPQSIQEASETIETGMIIPELGRNYLAYPDTSGTISFNNCWLSGREKLIDQWIEEFNTFYPNIEVVNDNAQDCSELLEYQKSLIGGGAPPDVMMVQSQNFRPFIEIDALRPLDDLIERDGIDPAWFYNSEWDSRRIDGNMYGMPNVTAGAHLLMFYKREYLEQAGLETIDTWQDMEALAQVAQDNNIFVLDPGKTAASKITFFQTLLYANGGKLWNDAFTEITWNSPEGLEAAEWLLNFIKIQAEDYNTLQVPGEHREIELIRAWATGPYITAIDGSWSFYMLNEIAPDLEFVVAPFPRNAQNPQSTGNIPVEGGWSFSIANNISPQNQAAAWEWIKFTTMSQFACEFTIAQLRPSPMRRCNEDERLSAQNPHWEAVEKALTQAEAVPTFAINLQLHEIVVNMQDAILFEQLTPAEALEVYANEAQVLLDEWNSQ